MLIPAYHEVFGLCLIPESKVRLHPEAWSTFNPAGHNADDVIAYLSTAGPGERDRVFDLERTSARPRKTVLALDTREEAVAEASAAETVAAVELATTPTPVAVGAGHTPATED